MAYILLNCKACESKNSMEPTKVRKMSPIVAFIGWLLTIPSIFGILIALMIFISSMSVGAGSEMQNMSDVDAVGTAIGLSIGIGASLLIGISSLIGGLLGYLLIMKKKVYKCEVCGYIIDRD